MRDRENGVAKDSEVTARAVKGAREEYLRLGYTNYLAKPIDGKKLEAMIQSYLPDEKILFVEDQQVDEEEASEVNGYSQKVCMVL